MLILLLFIFDTSNAALCTGGQYSSTGSDPCFDCGFGRYAVQGAASCTACPSSTNTTTPTASKQSDCFDFCAAGSYSNFGTGVAPCSLCEKGTFNADLKASTCPTCNSFLYRNCKCNSAGCSCTVTISTFLTSTRALASSIRAGIAPEIGLTVNLRCSDFEASGKTLTVTVDGTTIVTGGPWSGCVGCNKIVPVIRVFNVTNFAKDDSLTINLAASSAVNAPCGSGAFVDADIYLDLLNPSMSTPLAGATTKDQCQTQCGPGLYSSTGFEPCTPCEVGFYSNMQATLACFKCDNLTSTLGTGADQCVVKCKPGEYSASGFVPCQQCGVGSYSDSYMQTGCTRCAGSQSTLSTGSSSVSQCLDICVSGTISSTGLSPCSPCPRGSWSSGAGQTACTSCNSVLNKYCECVGPQCTCSVLFNDIDPTESWYLTAGVACSNFAKSGNSIQMKTVSGGVTSTILFGQTSVCVSCNNDYNFINQRNVSAWIQDSSINFEFQLTASVVTCTLLPSSQLRVSLSLYTRPQFTPFPAATSDAECVNTCLGGYYSSTGLEPCTPCPINTFANTSRLTTCTDCPFGLGTKYPSANLECQDRCPPGYYGVSGVTPCFACPTGTITNIYGQSSCTACPVGSWTRPELTAIKCYDICTSGQYSASGYPPCTSCDLGFYQPSSQQQGCLACPDGTSTYYRSASSSSACIEYVSVTAVLNTDLATISLTQTQSEFAASLTQDLATALAIPNARVRVTGLQSGSVRASMILLGDGTFKPTVLVTQIRAQLDDGFSLLKQQPTSKFIIAVLLPGETVAATTPAPTPGTRQWTDDANKVGLYVILPVAVFVALAAIAAVFFYQRCKNTTGTPGKISTYRHEYPMTPLTPAAAAPQYSQMFIPIEAQARPAARVSLSASHNSISTVPFSTPIQQWSTLYPINLPAVSSVGNIPPPRSDPPPPVEYQRPAPVPRRIPPPTWSVGVPADFPAALTTLQQQAPNATLVSRSKPK